MHVKGRYNKKPLHILIDSGSTHYFLDVHVVARIGCKIEDLKPLVVTVADGKKVLISSVGQNFTWVIQHTTFTSDVMLIPLGCCDIVLGIEWLITLGDITWNFTKLSMEFMVQDRRHVLRGSNPSSCKSVKSPTLDKIVNNSVHLSMIQVGMEGGVF